MRTLWVTFTVFTHALNSGRALCIRQAAYVCEHKCLSYSPLGHTHPTIVVLPDWMHVWNGVNLLMMFLSNGGGITEQMSNRELSLFTQKSI